MGPDERLAAPAMGAGAQRPAAVLIARLRERLAAGDDPLFVGIDGRSGVGKSTLAAVVSKDLAEPRGGAGQVTVIDGDDFYAGGSAEAWDRWLAAEKADRVIDWRRQRDVLEALRRVGLAAWHPFDWDAEDWDSNIVPLAPVPTVARAAPVVVLEGAYSCRPELHDLLDLRVLLDAPRDVRRRRLLEREGDAHQADWEARWATAEDHYFGTTMPPERFDLVLGSP
jgi:para-aminobenzoate synthetase